jgi:leucyl aminopeptidase
MAERAAISFVTPDRPDKGSVVVLTDKSLRIGAAGQALAPDVAASLARAAKAAKFEGSAMKTLELLAPAGNDLDRIVLVGLGEAEKMTPHEWLRLGGAIAGAVSGEGDATVLLERPDGEVVTPDQAASLALGVVLRAYRFNKYKTKKKDEPATPRLYRIAVSDPKAAARRWKALAPVADGVALARDLVNEPANALGPVEFADRLGGLADLGVEVELLDEEALGRHKMGALLGVAQGSARPPRVVVMRWNSGRAKDKPVAFVGKGVVFDSGGISIKPAQGMEDMKGDMGGAAAVAGLMHALAARKAKVNAVGVVGLVENMLDGAAQRPGDIVTSMSGKTIEVLNTDAEGRLVLADLLTFVQKTMAPSAIVDLATLTGAIMVALGSHHAGLFSNDDALAQAITQAGAATGEKVWRMPMGPDYDKLIDSKNADMKNIGGRYAGAIIGAQFLQRFIENDTPWAHLDIAGTAMGSPATETNASWASGYGVRLLDQFVRERFEASRREERAAAPA